MQILVVALIAALFSWVAEDFSKNPNSRDVYFDEQDIGGGQYILKWGVRGEFENTSSPIDFPRFDNTGLYSLGDSVITLTYSCGTSCTGAIMLPLFAGAKKIQTDAFLAAEGNSGLYAYMIENQVDSIIIIIQHIRQGIRANYVVGDLCPSIQAACIDTAYFAGNSFCISWRSGSWSTSNSGLKAECFSLP